MRTKYECCPKVSIKYAPSELPKVSLKSGKEVATYMRRLFDVDTLEYNESFYVLYLNVKCQTLGYRLVSDGGSGYVAVDIKMLLGPALIMGASNILVAHNHPSGNPLPSSADKGITAKIKAACEVMDICLLDHVIVSGDGRMADYSFAEEGIL